MHRFAVVAVVFLALWVAGNGPARADPPSPTLPATPDAGCFDTAPPDHEANLAGCQIVCTGKRAMLVEQPCAYSCTCADLDAGAPADAPVVLSLTSGRVFTTDGGVFDVVRGCYLDEATCRAVSGIDAAEAVEHASLAEIADGGTSPGAWYALGTASGAATVISAIAGYCLTSSTHCGLTKSK